MLLQECIPYVQQCTCNGNTMLKKYEYNINTKYRQHEYNIESI
jgi:hypothetical protein